MKFIGFIYIINNMSCLRYLTEYEIKDILSFIKPEKNIPLDVSYNIVKNSKKELRSQLTDIQIYPDMINSLKDEIKRQVLSTYIDPGESVGVISAQSIGEKQTQTTLNTFHKAGSSEKTVITGVPRIEELLSATKGQKSVNSIIFLKNKHKSIEDIRNTITNKITHIKLSKISKTYEICINKKPEKWYKAFDILYNDSYKKYSDCISIEIDTDLLFKHRITLKDISDVISDEYDDILCVLSPDNIGKIDIYVDTSKIELPEKRILFIDSDNAIEIYLEEVVQPLLYNLTISGIEGIENIYFNDDFLTIETDGGNLTKLLSLPFIDINKTITNDIWDIYNTLGIDAARNFLIEEFLQLCSGINRCHIQLLIDKMVFKGNISSISRYTMRNEDCGPLGKASFEETMDNFLKAGTFGQEETTNGVSASIICGKRSKIGSGFCDLIVDVDNL